MRAISRSEATLWAAAAITFALLVFTSRVLRDLSWYDSLVYPFIISSCGVLGVGGRLVDRYRSKRESSHHSGAGKSDHTGD